MRRSLLASRALARHPRSDGPTFGTDDMARKLIIDCDPGIDDAIALLLAMASPDDVDLLGVTVVGGNVGLDRTVINALAVVELARRDVPVVAGAARPMMVELQTAAHIHGDGGLRGADLPAPTQAPAPGHAVDWLRTTLRVAAPGSVTLCAIGPLTNVALALLIEPAIAVALDRIVLMGGAIGLGNVTPAAEFNIFVDPHAAQIVFAAGVPVVMVPLDVTHKAITSPARIAAIRQPGGPVARAVAGILDAYPSKAKFGGDGGPIHDACAIAWILRPEMMSGRKCNVRIDTGDGPSRGRTLVDWWGGTRNGPENALVLDRIDDVAFFALLTDRLARYAAD